MTDELQRWVGMADVDGFNLSYANIPEIFDIITYLLPELRRRRLFWTEREEVPKSSLESKD